MEFQIFGVILFFLMAIGGLSLLVSTTRAESKEFGIIGSGIFLVLCSIAITWATGAYYLLLEIGYIFHASLEYGLQSILPLSSVVAWAITGALVGLCIALWKESPTYGFQNARSLFVILPIAFFAFVGYNGYETVAKSKADEKSAVVEHFGKVIRADVSVRSGPGTKYKRVGMAPKGSRLRLFEKVPASQGRDWWKVEVLSVTQKEKKLTGYIREDFVQPDEVSETER